MFNTPGWLRIYVSRSIASISELNQLMNNDRITPITNWRLILTMDKTELNLRLLFD